MKFRIKLIGRLTTERYLSGNSIVEKKKFTILKRLSNGKLSDLVQDPQYDIGQINFSLYSDGLYELAMSNASIDIETGYADDWDLILIPMNGIKNETTMHK